MVICVYAAASTKVESIYTDAAYQIGLEIGRRGHELIFGAGGNGLMGATARGVKEAGGKVTGVIPKFFIDEKIEALYEHCDELIVTDSMHDRKFTMEMRADAFITVPGGIGTFEEFFETLTLKQLGRHKKPIAIYNVDGYYDPLEMLMFNGMKHKFIRAACDLMYLTFTDMDEMFDYVETDSRMQGLTVHDLKDG